jgi:uncharacterized protein YndB with AHSA1/START domain
MTLTRTFDAPRDLVWRAWADPLRLAKWWGPEGFSTTTHDMQFAKGGSWSYTMHGPDGRNYKNKVVYLDIDAQKRIVFRHTGEDGNEPVGHTTTATFNEENGVTTVTMHMDFGTAAAKDFVVKTYHADTGGAQTMARLGDFIDAKGDGNPEFIIYRTFDAPRDLVWRAWTDPAMLAQWFGPKGCKGHFKTFELKPGGVWHSSMTMPDGTEMWGKFIFREIVKPSKLVWVHGFSDAAGGRTRHPMSPTWPLEMLTTVTFEDKGAQTMVKVSWVPLNASDVETKTFIDGLAGMNGGWGGSFIQLAEFLKTAKAA